MFSDLELVSERVGLTMNMKKTKIMSTSDKHFRIERINIETVDNCIYLGHTIKLGI